MLICLSCWLLCAGLIYFRTLQGLENKFWDLQLNLAARYTNPDPSIKIIIIDQATLDYYDKHEALRWPFPRSLYVPVIKFLEQAGARGVAFDILFTEESVYQVQDDLDFADGISPAMPVVHAVALRSSDIQSERMALFESRLNQPSTFLKRSLAFPGVRKAEGVLLPVEPLLERATGFGNVSSNPDDDGIFRHYAPGGLVAGKGVLNLPFALYDAAFKDEQKQDVSDLLTQDGNLLVRFHGPRGTYQTENLANIVSSYVAMQSEEAPHVDPAEFKDALVFVGVWAPGLYDLRATPLDEVFRG